MKMIVRFLHVFVCIVFMLSSLVFAAVGGWQLFSGDWKLFENDSLALVQIIARILLCLYCFLISLRAALGKKPSFLREGIQLLGITLAAAPFISNHLGYLFVLIAVLFFISEPRERGFLSGRQKETGEKTVEALSPSGKTAEPRQRHSSHPVR